MKIILNTHNLCLRNLDIKDLDILHSYRNNKECAKYQSWKDTSKESLKTFIEKIKDVPIGSEWTQLAIAFKSTDELVGDMFIAFKDKTITLGYTIAPQYQRKGYATEILKAVISYLFDRYKGHEIVAMVHPENEASKRLLEKLGFESEGYVKKVDSIIYLMSDNKFSTIV